MATPDPLLVTLDARLRHLEGQVTDIHRALVGSTDGTAKGLQARVERLESWAAWIAGIVTAMVIVILSQLIKVH